MLFRNKALKLGGQEKQTTTRQTDKNCQNKPGESRQDINVSTTLNGPYHISHAMLCHAMPYIPTWTQEGGVRG